MTLVIIRRMSTACRPRGADCGQIHSEARLAMAAPDRRSSLDAGGGPWSSATILGPTNSVAGSRPWKSQSLGCEREAINRRYGPAVTVRDRHGSATPLPNAESLDYVCHRPLRKLAIRGANGLRCPHDQRE
jgi:hypothetical protein